ncbi:MAG: manganese efflux pump MntP family protein [Methanomassiliicoccaceae archaeon]|nr:manganese efflux pump MntP family protein [Methanomassiliicoccaceae archaeon]
MGPIELSILALGLAMDAFAVAIGLGLGMRKATVKKALTVGLYFGVFQAVMPLAGYFAARTFADDIERFDHWVVFALLLFLGAKMIAEGLGKDDGERTETSLEPKKMLPYAVATSIDALAVGISLAFLKADILSAAAIIGIITLALSMIGVKIGNIFGLRFRSEAEIAGGVILILIGVKILLEHLDILGL